MKKIIFALSVLLLASGTIFAQEAEEVKASAGINQRVGIMFNYEPSVGAIADYISCNAGGGISYELGIPFAGEMEFGFSGNAYFDYNPVKDDLLSYVWNTKFFAGAFIRIPIGGGFAFQPEFDYGITMYFPKANPKYDNQLDSTYTDQLLQLGLGFRYSSQSFAKDKIEIAVAPTYTYSKEQEYSTHYIGFKAGILLKL